MVVRRQPGDQIVVQFLIGDAPFLVVPITVVEDSADRILHYLAPGTPFLRRTLLDGSPVPRVVPLGELDRLGSKLVQEEWRGSRQLILTRPGRSHSIRVRWDAANDTFRGWYVNLQEPVQRTEYGFTTRDQFLDIRVAPDLSWAWKDEDELEEAVTIGRLRREEGAGIKEEGERLVADIEARSFPFDGSLTGWRPDPAWQIPELMDIDELAPDR